MTPLLLPKGINQYGDKYRWNICVNGQRKTGVCATLDDAVRERSEIYSALMIPQIRLKQEEMAQKTAPTLDNALDAMWRADWSKAKSAVTIDINSRFILSYFGADRRINTITTSDIDAFVVHLKALGNAQPTINRKLSIISKVLTRAYQKGQIDKVPYIERQPESPGRVRYILPEEEEQILALLEKWNEMRFYHVVRILIDTGIRCGELQKLTVYDIQPEQGTHGVIYLDDTKNGDNRAVPLTARALESLQYLAKTSKHHEKIICEYQTWITKTWNRIRKEMKKLDDPNFVPHILRHTCCSRLVQKGAPLKKVQMFMGHRTINTTMRYAHLGNSDIYDLPQLLE